MKREQLQYIPIEKSSYTQEKKNPARVNPRRGRTSRTNTMYIRKRRRKRKCIRYGILAFFLVVIIVCFFSLFKIISSMVQDKAVIKFQAEKERIESYESTQPEWTVDLLTLNPNSRPGTELNKVNNIFVHYTANPGTSAVQNRSYFEQLKDTKERSASAHFIIGYEGDIIQCVPLEEVAYAVKTRNEDSISIECCYIEEDGSFTQETYDSLIELLAWLTGRYGLETEDILRHYDCGGKKCPLYYTENEDEWIKLKEDVKEKMKGQGNNI